MLAHALRLQARYGSRSLLRENWLCTRTTGRLRRNETLSTEEITALQRKALQRTLVAAIDKLPRYARIPRRFPAERAEDVLREYFPVITKEDLLADRRGLYPHGGRALPWQPLGRTSGTTGTPLTIFRSPRSVLMENAFLRRHWSWGGYAQRMPRATLRGDLVVPVARREPPFWFWNRYDNQLLVSSRHLKEGCVDAIADALERFAPRMLQAYPSTAFTLAQLLLRRDRRLRIPVVFTASEPLHAHQRALIEERLGARVMDMYGMAERVAYATECEAGALHLNPDYAYVELVEADGSPARGAGFVCGTTFHNLAMPLVRYRLSDRTRWLPGACACGRPFPAIEPVTGKWEDRIFGSDSAPVSPSVLTFAFKGLRRVRQSQVAQVAPGRWEIRVVPEPGFGEPEARALVDNVHRLVDAHVRVEVVLRSELPCTEAGKFRWVVNESCAASPAT
jgi:phenylacetate-CoA ligase